jgi:hypothetical protein
MDIEDVKLPAVEMSYWALVDFLKLGSFGGVLHCARIGHTSHQRKLLDTNVLKRLKPYDVVAISGRVEPGNGEQWYRTYYKLHFNTDADAVYFKLKHL